MSVSKSKCKNARQTSGIYVSLHVEEGTPGIYSFSCLMSQQGCVPWLKKGNGEAPRFKPLQV